MIAPPGFFHFRWCPVNPVAGFEDVAIVFKVPGSVDLAVLPDLIEDVCRGPIVPSAVVFVHLQDDTSLVEAIVSTPTNDALMRFDGRMPLAVVGVDLQTFGMKLSHIRGIKTAAAKHVWKLFTESTEWLTAGLARIFKPEVILIEAPAGYVFHKPSSRRSSYFIRAEMALTTSGAVSFVALAIFHRLLVSYRKPPNGLKVLFVDTMSVATTAFALRELLSQAGVSPLPQIESFHSYGGMDVISDPLPGTSLCIISASSTMNLHRGWIEKKRLSDRDVLTLVTFDDAQDKDCALYALPSKERPEEPEISAKYDIRITGESFSPAMEPAKKILLTTTQHACAQYTDILHDFRSENVFGLFRATATSQTRRSLFVDGEQLLKTKKFQEWINEKLPHWLKAGTTQVIFQDDASSRILAQHIAYILLQLGGTAPTLVKAGDVSRTTIDSDGAIVCIASVISRGSSLLALSRELRNCHRGPRLYVIGMHVSDSASKISTFDSNLKHSAHGACIDVLRMQTCLMDDSVAESLLKELSAIYQVPLAKHESPLVLQDRAVRLRKGVAQNSDAVLLPTGANLNADLILNEGFAFWKKGYSAGPFQAEVVGTIAAILQNARTAASVAVTHRLRSPMLMQVALNPENFARFNDGIIQASILRAALPSELDYRGDAEASTFMRVFLERMAMRMGEPQQAELEFLTALIIGRLRLNDPDLILVRDAFQRSSNAQRTPMAHAVRYLLQQFPGEVTQRVAF